VRRNLEKNSDVQSVSSSSLVGNRYDNVMKESEANVTGGIQKFIP